LIDGLWATEEVLGKKNGIETNRVMIMNNDKDLFITPPKPESVIMLLD